MVEAMGGSDSPYYRHFRTYCCEAYNILRKSATLILSLFHLMAGAAIPDVRQDPEKAMLKLQVPHLLCVLHMPASPMLAAATVWSCRRMYRLKLGHCAPVCLRMDACMHL